MSMKWTISMKLLTLGNQKTLKGEGRGYLTGVLDSRLSTPAVQLAPARHEPPHAPVDTEMGYPIPD